MSDIKVSISCLTYNHADYIRQCLDGFIMQKTDFKFEVLVHDDASTDGTQDIIREYEEKYPDIIKPIYQTENQYSQGINIDHTFQWPRIKGKYFACCEGDDYWTDEYKLQKQYNAMESNPNCALCVHKVAVVDYNGTFVNSYCPNDNSVFSLINNSILQSADLVNFICKTYGYPFQTSSFFMNSEIITTNINNIPDFMKNACVGDIPLLFLASCYGDFYYLDDIMSCYRYLTPNGWNDKKQRDLNTFDAINYNHIEFFKMFNEYSDHKYNDSINYYISKTRYFIAVKHEDYKKVFEPDLKEVFKDLPLKTKFHLVVLASFPKLAKNIEKEINRFRNGRQQ